MKGLVQILRYSTALTILVNAMYCATHPELMWTVFFFVPAGFIISLLADFVIMSD